MTRPNAIAIAAIVLLSIITTSCPSAASRRSNTDYTRQGNFRATGSVSNIDLHIRSFDVIDHDSTLTVLAGQAIVQLNNGRMGHLSDLRDNALVRVMGEQLSARTILADTVIVLEGTGRLGNRAQSYRPNDRVQTDGFVTLVEPSYSEVNVRTDSGRYTVVVRPTTLIRRYIYVTDIDDINEGDDVTVTGAIDRDGRIIAERIQVASSDKGDYGGSPKGKSYHPRQQPEKPIILEDIIEGTITYPAASFDRTFAMQTDFGERKVDVTRGADVRINGRRASVSNLRKGTEVRAYGSWDGATLVATRVETIEKDRSTHRPADQGRDKPANRDDDESIGNKPPREKPIPRGPITGRISSIDYAKCELTIDAGMKDIKIDARDAAVTRKGSTRRFSELRKGDKVEVTGEPGGEVFTATSVDVVE